VAWDWNRLHNEELHNLHASPDIIRVSSQVKEDTMGKASSTHGRDENTYNILVEKICREEPLGRPRRRWRDNIKTDLRETG
jgi:hypothetical protein